MYVVRRRGPSIKLTVEHTYSRHIVRWHLCFPAAVAVKLGLEDNADRRYYIVNVIGLDTRGAMYRSGRRCLIVTRNYM
jgi:hypothetical protein